MIGNLERLKDMKDNWDGRGSSAPYPEALATAANMTAVPLGSGGIQLELHAGGADIEIEISLTGKITSVMWSSRL